MNVTDQGYFWCYGATFNGAFGGIVGSWAKTGGGIEANGGTCQLPGAFITTIAPEWAN